MRDFLRHLRAAWKYGRTFPFFVEADSQAFWDEDDARNTKLFFESRTGKKLSMRLTNFAIKMALSAMQDSSGSKNGDARGVTACIAAIEAHYPQQIAEPVESPAMELVTE